VVSVPRSSDNTKTNTKTSTSATISM
jgi:hypothetical protein